MDLIWEQEAAGSNPAIPTSSEHMSILANYVGGATWCGFTRAIGRRPGDPPAVPPVDPGSPARLLVIPGGIDPYVHLMDCSSSGAGHDEATAHITRHGRRIYAGW
jgi:hypothetical protein